MGGIATIGIEGWQADEFLGALTGAAVGVVIDLRRSPSISENGYGWAEPGRLREALAATGIEYRAAGAPEEADPEPIAELASRTLPALLCDRPDRGDGLADRLERDHGLTVIEFQPPRPGDPGPAR